MLFGSVLLALAWSALLGEFSLGNLVAGATLGYVVLRGLAIGGVLPTSFRGKVREALSLLVFLIVQLVAANIRMMVDVLRWRTRIAPAVIGLPLDVESDVEILLLAALINITPGSVALDVSEDRKTMYVHVMHVSTPDEARAEIKNGFERRVIKLFA
jgi:multicomponent Na+:H+ antiporter subunit E